MPRSRGSPVVAAARRAIQQEGEYFVLLLDFYLKDTYGGGVEVVSRDRKKLHAAIAKLA